MSTDIDASVICYVSNVHMHKYSFENCQCKTKCKMTASLMYTCLFVYLSACMMYMCVCPYVYVCLCVVEPSTVYGFHCMQESLQIASNILSPNYTSQWGTLNKVSTYTQHSTTQSPGSGQLYEAQLCHMHSTEDMNAVYKINGTSYVL